MKNYKRINSGISYLIFSSIGLMTLTIVGMFVDINVPRPLFWGILGNG